MSNLLPRALHAIEFFNSSDGAVEAVIVSAAARDEGARQWPARCLSIAAQLAPAGAVYDEALSGLWGVVVLCTPEYAAYQRAMLSPERPSSASRIFFLNQ